MKRVFCLLLCLTLLCGLLPTAVLADNGQPLYFAPCEINGTALPDERGESLNSSYGEICYFRVYTDAEYTAAVTGDSLGLYESNQNITSKALKWVADKGYYVWDTRTATKDMLVFTYEDNNISYEGFAYPHTAVVGWFSSKDTKSIGTALTYANEKNADVRYDGEEVTVYLTAEDSFFTEISNSDVTASEGVTSETFERKAQYSEGQPSRGVGLKVTCPQGLSGEPWVEVTVRQKFVLDEDYEIVTYKVTFSADGVSVENPSGGKPGEPVLLPGVTNDYGNQVYFGIGVQTNAGNYAVASNSRFTGPSTEQTTEVFKPCFFTKSAEGYTATELPANAGVTVGAMSEPTCDDTEKTLPEGKWVKDEKNGTYSLTLSSDMVGTWTITASCTVGGTTYSVSCYSERVNAEEATIDGENVNDVAAINTKLTEVINSNTDAVKYVVVKLNSGEYTGTIEIPKETKGRMIVILQGKRDSQGNHTILQGGIKSDCDTVSVENIDFRGADYKETKTEYTGSYSNTWTSGENNGKDNYALYGSGRGNSANCSFEGYKRAIVWTEGSRLLGHNNTYRYNDIGWYIDIDDSYDNGLNTDASGSRFENNNYAIWAQSFGGFKYTNDFAIHVRENVFIDNDFDVYNFSNRWWYIPGNYFEHNGVAGPDLRTRGESGTSCYPMAEYKIVSIVPNSYTYDQLTEGGDTLSNELAETYPIPENELDGKVFHVSTANEDKTDEVLATFSFPETQTSTQAIALFAEPDMFNATVSVDRSNADSIVFTMCDPLKTVNVKVPCTFADGTVTHNNVEIEDAVFNGTSVSFPSTEKGEYIITKTGAEPAAGGASGGLTAGIAAAGSGSGTFVSASQFADLTAGSWYYEAVRSALKNGLMNGTSAHTFSPDAPMTRAMLVTILWRMAGQPSAKTSPFTDVVSGSWYAQAVNWAYDRGIVTGVSETAFAPNESVTREALVTILYRYAALKQNLPAAEDAAARFADGRQVSSFAHDSVNWALQTGLLTGVSKTKLSPKGFATRAQIAVLMERFLKL